jgi:peptidoglycan/xylan/chitin deacetylase (PgdA/CDA1 family)
LGPNAKGSYGIVPPDVSLTFDDGPDRSWTRCVLAELERSGATATFFMVGERVAADPHTARAVRGAGHEIELHCHRHVRHTVLSEAEIERDTTEGLKALAALGIRPRRWRTPWGVTTTGSRRVAHRHGLELVGWTIDTHDWRGDASAAMLARAGEELAGGGVVLMHDALGPGALRAGCEQTVELVGGLVAAARARGLTVGPLGKGA